MLAFAAEWLTQLCGSEIIAGIKKSSATRWNAAPFALGAMSVAAPGAQPSRKILTEPMGCLFLAGEATHETMWGTVDGAWESGERAAEAALRRIGALKDESVAPAPATKRRRAAPARSAGAPVNWRRRKFFRQILHRQRQLHQVLGDDDPAGKILLHVLGPVVVGHQRIVAGDEMAEGQHLHAGGGGDAADVLGGGMALEQMFLQRRAVLGLAHE